MEDVPSTGGATGSYHHHTDTPMDVDATPVTIPGVQVFFGIFNGGTSTSHTSPPDDEEEMQPPPAKRRRVHSDADQASLAHVSIHFCCLVIRYRYARRL
jgi:hypothetical protein